MGSSPSEWWGFFFGNEEEVKDVSCYPSIEDDKVFSFKEQNGLPLHCQSKWRLALLQLAFLNFRLVIDGSNLAVVGDGFSCSKVGMMMMMISVASQGLRYVMLLGKIEHFKRLLPVKKNRF